MSSLDPIISVIIPTYNTSEKLIETVSSVQRQTFSDWEIIIIDDCSSDQTITIAQDLSNEDSRIHVTSLEKNSNRPAVPRNAGIARARGKYIAFLDHDDLWFPRKLERHLLLHSKYPDLALTHSAMWHYPNRKSLRTLLELPNPLLQKSSQEALKKRNLIYCSSVVVKSESIALVGGFDERSELRAVEDYALWLRVTQSSPFAFIPEILGFYRSDDSSTYNHQEVERRLDILRAEGLAAPKPPRRNIQMRLATRSLGLVYGVWLYGIMAPIKQYVGIKPTTI